MTRYPRVIIQLWESVLREIASPLVSRPRNKWYKFQNAPEPQTSETLSLKFQILPLSFAEYFRDTTLEVPCRCAPTKTLMTS
jgi:hypothetical protein